METKLTELIGTNVRVLVRNSKLTYSGLTGTLMHDEGSTDTDVYTVTHQPPDESGHPSRVHVAGVGFVTFKLAQVGSVTDGGDIIRINVNYAD